MVVVQQVLFLLGNQLEVSNSNIFPEKWRLIYKMPKGLFKIETIETIDLTPFYTHRLHIAQLKRHVTTRESHYSSESL